MTLNQIRYFLEVAEQLNISRAAQNLYITQPALGRQITALEDELNMQLFRRSTRKLTLTPAGAYLYKQWSDHIQSIDNTIIQAKKINAGYSGTITLGILEDIDLSLFFADILLTFEKQYPNIQIKLRQYSFGDLRKKLFQQELDGILTYLFDIQNLENIQHKNLYQIHPVWAIPLANPLSQKESISVSDLKDQEFILINNDDCSFGAQLLTDICQTYGGFSPKVFIVDYLEEAILRLETGNRCSIMNQELRIANSSKIKMFPLEDYNELAYFTFVWNNSPQNISFQLFLDIISRF